MKLVVGKVYKLELNDGEIIEGVFTGRQKHFECSVCGKGNNAFTFNVYYTNDNGTKDYETYGFGKEHLPKILAIIKE